MMTARHASTFNYNFRVPGSKIEGTIYFAFGRTTCDMVLVGKSNQGICAILLGDNEELLSEQLAAAFPHTEFDSDQRGLSREVAQITAFIEGGVAEDVIDLDIGGTLFQQEVWRELCGIPTGQTRSYGEVARHLGIPGAARAVAGACAENLLAVAIPCHRVVGLNGLDSGYRWGVERKQALLVKEVYEQ
ncbi:methylated-DNA--[protein]-cysteine S-methyltransferase [Caballeronia jiangsuensis]|uniref:Methylated-DNA--[protein]-cysteine S-methyltransferase n=1 Tax=Caballeronia jiangsuensis TaxID=1458357 RepID=A0ABW9D084_9BURK